MTRPAGTTPNFQFPFPGTELVIANIPGAMKALADAISGNLSGVGGGIVFAYWHGGVSFSNGSADFNAPAKFPTLATIAGMVAVQGDPSPDNSTLMGGLTPAVSTGVAKMTLWPMQTNLARFAGLAEIAAIAWGTPK